MTKDEFIKTSSSLGYASKVETENWCELNPKEAYAEKDYEELFRWVDSKKRWDIQTLSLGFGGKTTKRYRHTYKM